MYIIPPSKTQGLVFIPHTVHSDFHTRGQGGSVGQNLWDYPLFCNNNYSSRSMIIIIIIIDGENVSVASQNGITKFGIGRTKSTIGTR